MGYRFDVGRNLTAVFTHVLNQQAENHDSTSITSMLKLRQARLGVNGCIISGIVLGSLYGLMPLYLNHKGVSNASIGFWMAVLVSAGILGQWPIGRLADKFGRLLVLRVQVFVVILGSIAMLSQAAMAPALFILGAAGFTLYPVAMAWACEKVEHHQLVAMNQALLLSYTVGSLLGPSFTAMLMQNFSDNLLFIDDRQRIVYLFADAASQRRSYAETRGSRVNEFKRECELTVSHSAFLCTKKRQLNKVAALRGN